MVESAWTETVAVLDPLYVKSAIPFPSVKLFKLLTNEINYVSNDKATPELIVPWSFNTLHDGHLKMR